jgi:hypothetical protein
MSGARSYDSLQIVMKQSYEAIFIPGAECICFLPMVMI